MKFSHFFIDRPIFAAVLSVVTLIAGGLAYRALPLAQYPEIVPPTVEVTARYPGADPKVIADAVATPIEQEVNGVENMLYMSSQSTGDGVMTLTVTFKLGTNLDLAQVLVQNRVALAEARLPDAVRKLGVTTKKKSPNLMMVVNLLSPDNAYDQAYISNYAYLQVRDVLARLEGVGDVVVLGAREYSMRVWLDPDRMWARQLTSEDVVSAIQAQNVQVAAGRLGAEPAPRGTELQLSLNAEGRLRTPEDFGQIIVKRGDDGSLVYLGDVARVELGARDYSVASYLDGKASQALIIYQSPGANAVATAHRVSAAMQGLAKNFPKGLQYAIVYNTTTFVEQSIEAVIHTLIEAIVLVLIVVLVFLQSWRATLIPMLAVPVSLVGTFAVMAAFGFSLNNLSLFGLVLAIGIVVDDAIVVVEAVELNLAKGLEPKEATRKAMDQVGGAVLAVAVVLSAVFIPTAFISGITGQFYRQFALTIAVSTLISAFNSLTLSPALAGLLLKPHHAKKDLITRGLELLLGWFFRLFNRGFDAATHAYAGAVRRLVRLAAIVLLAYAGLLVLTLLGFKTVPVGFIPLQDQGYLIGLAQLPDGASLQRADEMRQQMVRLAAGVPGVSHTVEFTGFSGLDGTNRSNAVTTFLVLAPFEERVKDPRQNGLAILAEVQRRFATLQDGRALVFPPPPVQGIGNAGGFKLQVQDRRGAGLEALQAATDRLMAQAMQRPGIAAAFTTLRSQGPQLYLDIDRRKVQTLGVSMGSVFDALQAYLGSTYVNDFNFLNRTYQVNVQAEGAFRLQPESLRGLYVRNRNNEMVSLGTLLNVRETNGPDKVMHHNLYPSADVNGVTLPGFSSGQAMATMERLAADGLPSQFGYEWTELALQQKLAGNSALYIFPLCVLFVFLVLAAQYESWALPMAIILIVPMCLLAAISGVYLRQMDNNVFTQIGFVVLVGLACKNAILIVEYAKQQMDAGVERREAAVNAARLRLRPILMTSLAFTLGVWPLVIAAGAGAEMRQALGTAVFSGMIGVTLFGIFLTPVFFSVIMKFFGPKGAARPAPVAPVAHEPAPQPAGLTT
jgi:hydrophobe/amphiphile efflux-1 (HAE1) family protein